MNWKESLNELINVLRKESDQCRCIQLMSQTRIWLKWVACPYCKQVMLQTVVSTCKSKKTTPVSSVSREPPFLPNDYLSVWEMYADKGESQTANSAKNGFSCMWARGTPKHLLCRIKSKLVPQVKPLWALNELHSCICIINVHYWHSVRWGSVR